MDPQLIGFVLVATSVLSAWAGPPNIVVIMADDMGWNDVSYHGSDQILTPNIDVIGYQGVMLHQYYTDAFGTPSRSAFFTGKYPSTTGTQSESIRAAEDRGLSVTEKLLPSYLKDLGYSTHLVGKWGLGKSREQYLPTNRGFDSFFGFLDGAVDYYTYNLIEKWNRTEYFGLDLYENLNPVEDTKGHLSDVLTDRAVQLIREHDTSEPLYLQLSHAAPHAGGGLVSLQAAPASIDSNDHIAHSARRLYAGMVTQLDKSVGHIMAVLAEKEILQNTIVVFISDNGAAPVGPTQNFGSNLPFRGCKGTPWEGGVRASALLWHADLVSEIWHGLFHVTDWLPTLVAAAGGNVSKVDGVNQWSALKDNTQSTRESVLISIDDLNGWAAYREGDFKFVVGHLNNEASKYHGSKLMELRLQGPAYENSLLECETARIFKEFLERDLSIDNVIMKRNDSSIIKIVDEEVSELCIPSQAKGCLYNIKDDPFEANDLWNASPDLVKLLTLKIRSLWANIIPRSVPKLDNRANPSKKNFIWSPWVKEDEPYPQTLLTPPLFPLQVSKAELQYLVDLNLGSFKEKMFDYIQNMGDSFVKSVGGLFNF
nr:sulphatase [Yponomeuta cagnagella]